MRALPALVAVALLVNALAVSPARSQQALTPLGDYLAGIDADDTVAMTHVLKRCAAAYFTVVRLLEGSTVEGAATASQRYGDAAMKLLVQVTEAEATAAGTGTGAPREALRAEIMDEVLMFSGVYGGRVAAERERSGDGAKDPLFSGDVQFCNQLTAAE